MHTLVHTNALVLTGFQIIHSLTHLFTRVVFSRTQAPKNAFTQLQKLVYLCIHTCTHLHQIPCLPLHMCTYTHALSRESTYAYIRVYMHLHACTDELIKIAYMWLTMHFFTCISRYIHTLAPTNVLARINTWTHTHICLYFYTHVRVLMHLFRHVCRCIYSHMYKFICIRSYIYTHVYTHMHTFI